VNLRITSGPVLERPYDLVGILTSLEHRDVLFIDEIHRLPRAVEEYLYSAMEDFRIDIVIDQGPAARSVPIDLRRFTLIGATTREGLLSAPMRSRFGVLERLDFYPPEELVEVLRRSSSLLGIEVEEPALRAMASRSRGTPRVANRFLRRIRDLAQVKGAGAITVPVADEGLAMLGVDEHGLTPLDREILRCLQRLGGGPVGLKTVAISVGEEERTLEDVYEPFLIRQGLLLRTPRGRKLTLEGRKLLRPGPRDGLFA
jgi:Holliday junction DNA helicase RuvB